MMKSLFALGLAAATLAPADTSSPHADDTIYIVRGDANALRRFQAMVDDHWAGGTALDGDPSDGSISYWAFATRTAAEARAFLMPAAMFGLDLKIEQYNEYNFFPTLRKQLDRVAEKCRVTPDLLWIRPTGSIQIEANPAPPRGADKCLENELSLARLKFSTVEDRSN